MLKSKMTGAGVTAVPFRPDIEPKKYALLKATGSFHKCHLFINAIDRVWGQVLPLLGSNVDRDELNLN